MAKDNPSFWATLPGVLTGITGVIVAITGLYSTFHSAAVQKPPSQGTTTPANVESSPQPAASAVIPVPGDAATNVGVPGKPEIAAASFEPSESRVDEDEHDPKHCNVRLDPTRQFQYHIVIRNPSPGNNKIAVTCQDCGDYSAPYEFDIRTRANQYLSKYPYLSSPGKLTLSYGTSKSVEVTKYQANAGCQGGVLKGLKNVLVRIDIDTGP